MTKPDDWISMESYGYSPLRYDPADPSDVCEGCGGPLVRGGGAAEDVIRCARCGYDVYRSVN